MCLTLSLLSVISDIADVVKCDKYVKILMYIQENIYRLMQLRTYTLLDKTNRHWSDS